MQVRRYVILRALRLSSLESLLERLPLLARPLTEQPSALSTVMRLPSAVDLYRNMRVLRFYGPY